LSLSLVSAGFADLLNGLTGKLIFRFAPGTFKQSPNLQVVSSGKGILHIPNDGWAGASVEDKLKGPVKLEMGKPVKVGAYVIKPVQSSTNQLIELELYKLTEISGTSSTVEIKGKSYAGENKAEEKEVILRPVAPSPKLSAKTSKLSVQGFKLGLTFGKKGAPNTENILAKDLSGVGAQPGLRSKAGTNFGSRTVLAGSRAVHTDNAVEGSSLREKAADQYQSAKQNKGYTGVSGQGFFNLVKNMFGF